MMGNCKDCKHWTFKIARRGLCEIISEKGTGDPERLAYVVDYEVAPTHLVTDKLFGCVLFEKKHVGHHISADHGGVA